VYVFGERLVMDAERVPAFIALALETEEYSERYTNGAYLKRIKPMESSIEITPLSDEHYKIYKIAGEQE